MGGKGGFGSLLRSIKPGKKAVENFDACRDLTTGRRLGQIQQQERIQEWQHKKEKEDKFVAEELKKYEQTKNMMKSQMDKNQYRKLDQKYISSLHKNDIDIKSAVK